MKKIALVYIDNEPFQFDVEGDFFWGENELLYTSQDSIISKMAWQHDGYGIVDAFSDEAFNRLHLSIKDNIARAILKYKPDFNTETFHLEDYHNVVTTPDLHGKVIAITRNLQNSDFDFDIEALANKFGTILGYKLTSWIEELKKSHIQIRISRPNSLDINPPHRDGYLSFWKDIINVWVPIVGCNNKSSLPVLPQSHLISENAILRTSSRGAKINGNIYNVPCILKIRDRDITMLRPNPEQGQALLFTPFLIHGAAVNTNADLTRVSLELRFPRVL